MATFALHDLEYGEPRRREGALRRVGPRRAVRGALGQAAAGTRPSPGRPAVRAPCGRGDEGAGNDRKAAPGARAGSGRSPRGGRGGLKPSAQRSP